MIRVYVAGPYSLGPGGPAGNVANAIRAANELLDLGFSPYVPHLSHYLNEAQPRAYEVWLRHDLEWLTQCAAVLRIPGHSPGADQEVLRAERCKIPVFHDVSELVAWRREWNPLDCPLAASVTS